MSCRFLENLTLATMVAPVPDDIFRSRYWEQEPLVVKRGDPNYYEGLFSIEDFDKALTQSPDYVKIADAHNKKNMSYRPGMVQGMEGILESMRGGGTLVLDQLHRSDPKLAALCRALGPELGHRFQTNLYLTPPHGRGFTPHWDNHDVFILQVVGSKHWKVEKVRRTHPSPGAKMGDEGRELRGELHEFTLEQGDICYIPRGFVHAAECGDEPSLHITFGVVPVFFDELLQSAVRAAVQQDTALRAALPLGFMQASGEDLVDRLMSALLTVADEKFLAWAVDKFRDHLVHTYPIDVSGQVVDFIRPKPLEIEEVVGPRKGIVYRLHKADDAVRVYFGARSITFLSLFNQAVDFALREPAYAIKDIPGDLEDEERIVFVERLMEEGLVVRRTDALA